LILEIVALSSQVAAVGLAEALRWDSLLQVQRFRSAHAVARRLMPPAVKSRRWAMFVIPPPAIFPTLDGIDILINNASGFGMGDDEAGWSAGLSVDVMAMVRASHAALPFLLKADGASIIHISSIAAFRPSTRAAAYAAVKAAMISYTGSQAAMLARQRIRVNCIAPGSIEFAGGVWDQRKIAGDALYDRTLNSIPFGRMGTPEEIADVALFLGSRYARWVTGQTVAVDGGQLLGA
jgi:3-oxoacyl-[acyl-carrier protein] reductase